MISFDMYEFWWSLFSQILVSKQAIFLTKSFKNAVEDEGKNLVMETL